MEGIKISYVTNVLHITNVMQQSACSVVNPIMVGNSATVGWPSMMDLTLSHLFYLVRAKARLLHGRSGFNWRLSVALVF